MGVSVSAVAFQDEGRWIAQCLEYDIAVSTDSIGDLHRKLERAMASNLLTNRELGRNGFEGIPPAPTVFRDMFDRSETVLTTLAVSDGSPPVEVRAMRLAEPALE